MHLSVNPFALLAPLLLMLLGLGQIGMWKMWRSHQELSWLGTGLIGVGLGILLQLLWPASIFFRYVLFSSACYITGFACIAQALAARLKVPLPYRQMLLVIGVCMLAQIWCTEVQPHFFVRIYITNVAVMLLVALPLRYWHQMQVRNPFDRALRVLYLLFIVINLLRVVILLPMSLLRGVDLDSFAQSDFWLWSHILAMLLGMLVAGMMFFTVLHDVLLHLNDERLLDPLTQLLNRRGFDEMARRQGLLEARQCWAMLVCDIDHFKKVNDTWGHAAGDEVLRQIAKILQQQVRSSDLVARFGGEEFVVLLAGTDAQRACKVAERMCQCVASTSMPVLQGQSITLSIGVATLPNLEPAQLAQALQDADAQLYVAKRAGRNQVAVQTV
ncbi:MAG: GGDEF domain-containing protein [Comamonas sp.]|nr:GGDEF domain-containing protein [Candidatus Comamonas equi]